MGSRAADIVGQAVRGLWINAFRWGVCGEQVVAWGGCNTAVTGLTP